jgi:hypothetical protein
MRNLVLSKIGKKMKEKDINKNLPVQQDGNENKKSIQGYPVYPASEDIFSKGEEDKEINPEEISNTDESIEAEEVFAVNDHDINSDESNNDLDVPGSELDDEQEDIGSEDEENNYYSIGGDDHLDLDEDHGE